ncbi:MAG: hypothetical protein WBD69_10770, partial [Candidatus Cybelea sp.]
MRGVDVLPAIRSSRYDLPLTYDPGDSAFAIGDVVRVPLGSRDTIGFVVSEVYELEQSRALRPVRERVDCGRAFDGTGLALARFVAEQYLCTLGEALGAVVLGGAVPRIRDVLARTEDAPGASRSVPVRLVRLIWEEFAESFTLDQLVR